MCARELANGRGGRRRIARAVLDKAVTTTNVDLVFTRVKDKAARKIDFAQFKAGLRLLADAKYPGADGAYERLVTVVTTAEGPRVDASRAATDGICASGLAARVMGGGGELGLKRATVRRGGDDALTLVAVTPADAKLTDASMYTGAHKERFDEEGHGKGLAGRDSVATGGGCVRACGATAAWCHALPCRAAPSQHAHHVPRRRGARPVAHHARMRRYGHKQPSVGRVTTGRGVGGGTVGGVAAVAAYAHTPRCACAGPKRHRH